MKKIAFCFVAFYLLTRAAFPQLPAKLWSTSYEIDYSFPKETGFSFDSKYFAVGNNSGKVTIYESATGNAYTAYQFHNSKVYSTIFQPNGNLLASSDKDGKIVLYDYVAKKNQASMQAHSEAITTLCFSPDGNKLYSGSHDNSVKVWSVPSGRLINTIYGFNGKVKAVRITPDQKTLVVATTSIYNGMTFCDIASGSKTTLEAANLQKIAVTPDGNYAIIASLNKYMSIWDINSGLFKNKIEGHEKYVNDVVLSPDGKILISGSNDKTVKIWDLEKQTVLATLPGDKNYCSLSLSPNGKYLATLDEKPLVIVWDVSQYVKVIEPIATTKSQAESLPAAAVAPSEKTSKPGDASTQAKTTETVPAKATDNVPATVVPAASAPVQNDVKTQPKPVPSTPPGKMKSATGKKAQDIDGNLYNVIKFGNQMWMAENLSVSKFRNGELIPQAKTEKEWIDANDKKQAVWCYYQFNAANGKKYGKLYNWYAVNDERGLAPEGWRVPSLNDWVDLDNTLGGQRKAAQRLKSAAPGEWAEPFTTDSISGFNALPSGAAKGTYQGGELFQDLHYKVSWWTSVDAYKDKNLAVVHGIFKGNPDEAKTSTAPKTEGLAVRCLKGVPYKGPVIKLQDDEWMQKNLEVKTFRNGDPIPEARTNQEWALAAKEHKPAWCKAPVSKQGDDVYGILYNGYAVDDPRGLAPPDWNITNDYDWVGLMLLWKGSTNPIMTLETLKDDGFARWDTVKTKEFYSSLYNDFKLTQLVEFTNASFFSAMPGGRRLADGKFTEQGQSAYFWIEKEKRYSDLSPFALISVLGNSILTDPKDDLSKVIHYYADKGEGYSIRCVKQKSSYIIQ